MITELNGRWVDENNNSWSKAYITKEQAEADSKTLINCRYCSDCSGCSCCRYCSDCSGCSCCRDCSDCSDCSGCSCCRYCSDCSGCSGCSCCHGCSYCSDCSGCSDFKINPQHYSTGLIGSRKAQTHIYWLGKQVQVICGCFKGTLDEFIAKVKTSYPDKKKVHRKEYDKAIKVFKMLIKEGKV